MVTKCAAIGAALQLGDWWRFINGSIFDPVHELWAELPKLVSRQEIVGSKCANLLDGCRSAQEIEDRIYLLVALFQQAPDRQVSLMIRLRGV